MPMSIPARQISRSKQSWSKDGKYFHAPLILQMFSYSDYFLFVFRQDVFCYRTVSSNVKLLNNSSVNSKVEFMMKYVVFYKFMWHERKLKYFMTE